MHPNYTKDIVRPNSMQKKFFRNPNFFFSESFKFSHVFLLLRVYVANWIFLYITWTKQFTRELLISLILQQLRLTTHYNGVISCIITYLLGFLPLFARKKTEWETKTWISNRWSQLFFRFTLWAEIGVFSLFFSE